MIPAGYVIFAKAAGQQLSLKFDTCTSGGSDGRSSPSANEETPHEQSSND